MVAARKATAIAGGFFISPPLEKLSPAAKAACRPAKCAVLFGAGKGWRPSVRGDACRRHASRPFPARGFRHVPQGQLAKDYATLCACERGQLPRRLNRACKHPGRPTDRAGIVLG